MTAKFYVVNYLKGLLLFLLQYVFVTISILLQPFAYLLVKLQYGQNIKPCTTGMDVILGLENSGPTAISVTLKIKGVPDYEKILAKWKQVISFQTNLGPDGQKTSLFYAPYDRLRWIPITKYFFVFFKKDDKFNMKNHISFEYFNEYEPYDIKKFGSPLDAKISDVCEYYVNHTFSKDRPQWRVIIAAPAPPQPRKSEIAAEDIDPNSEYGLIIAMNHIYMDGVTNIQMLQHTIADNAFQMTIDPMKTPKKQLQKPAKSAFEKVVSFLKLVFTAPHEFASMVISSAKERHILKIKRNTKLNPKRSSHWIEYDLKKLKSVNVPLVDWIPESEPVKVRLNTLILASVTKAYESLFKISGAGIPDHINVLIASAPLPYKSLTLLSLIVTTVLSIPLGITNKTKMVETVEDCLVQATTEDALKASQMTVDACGSLIAPFLKFLQANVFTSFTCVSTVIGTEESFTVFGGDLVTSMIVHPTLLGNNTANIVTLNYNHKLCISITADEFIVNQIPGLPQQFLESVRDELDSYVTSSKKLK